MIEATAAVDRGPRGPWPQHSPEATGLTTEAQEVRREALPAKLPRRLGQQLSVRELEYRVCHLLTNNGKGKSGAIMQSS